MKWFQVSFPDLKKECPHYLVYKMIMQREVSLVLFGIWQRIGKGIPLKTRKTQASKESCKDTNNKYHCGNCPGKSVAIGGSMQWSLLLLAVTSFISCY